MEQEKEPQEQKPTTELPEEQQVGNTEHNNLSVAAAGDPLTVYKRQLFDLDKRLAEKNFRDFWFYAVELKKEIFQRRGLSREVRQCFLGELDSLFEKAKAMEDETRNLVAQASELKLKKVREMIDQVLAQHTEQNQVEPGLAELDKISAFIREGSVELPMGISLPDMLREQREQARELVRKAREALLNRLHEQRQQHYQIIQQKLQVLSDKLTKENKPLYVLKNLKAVRAQMFSLNLDRAHIRELDQVMQALWKSSHEAQQARGEDDARRRIREMEQILKHKQQLVSAIEKEVKDLELRWSGVKNDFFRTHLQEIMAEKRAKAEEAQKDIFSLKEKIAFLNERLKQRKEALQQPINDKKENP
ncbi:MAG: hypothetical protein RMK52_02165 [Chitinophagales bacterium]|nr:hypothetical protein [Chitinophagales bacterium]MDW8393029.1 hypothetical protein [Chitinophagales bacterium]